ncbi:MAG: 50S ribosomal protein L40e [Candidatus Aenigmatarchaeota archaeon]
MAKKIPDAAMKRLFANVFVCMNCNAKIRASYEKVKKGKIKCRKCGSKDLRVKAKERRGQKV